MSEHEKNNVLGFFVNICSMLMFVVTDILIKHLTQFMPTFEIIFYRCLSGLPFFLIYIYIIKGFNTLKMFNVKLQITRMILGVLGMVSFVSAYKNMPLAEAASILYTSPIILTIIIFIFFKEKIRIHRTIALIMGIIGSLLIIRPGINFQIYSLYALFGAINWAFVIITMRTLSKTDHANSITLYFSLAGVFIGGSISLFNGMTPIVDMPTVFFLILMGVAGILAQLFMIISVEMCETSLFASSKYINLVLTSIGAYIVFNEVLSNQSLLGMVLIITGGLYMVWREHVLNKTKRIKIVRY